MKNRRIFLSAVIAVLTAVFVLSGTVSAAGYTANTDVEYKAYTESGINVISNWGTRGEISTFLSVNAEKFYEGTYTYDTLSELSGGSGISDAPESLLYASLKTLMTDNHTNIMTYQNTRPFYKYTDSENNDISYVISFYSGNHIGSDWDPNNNYTREHTWPNSKCITDKNKKGDGSDIMMLRPVPQSENSSRGNKAYGIGIGFYEPEDEVKGDCARSLLYGYTRWGNTSNMWGENGVIENLDILLQWMEEDPVDTWEMARNDSVESITGTRNVFIDYPEYAWLLFGEEFPDDMSTPSGEAKTATEANKNDSENSGGIDAGSSGNTDIPNDGADNTKKNNDKMTAIIVAVATTATVGSVAVVIILLKRKKTK